MALDSFKSPRLARAIARLAEDPYPDQRRKFVVANTLPSSALEGDYVLYTHEPQGIFVSKYFIDREAGLVHVRSIVKQPLYLL